MSTKTIKVNNQDILVITEGNEKYVAIKPICEAIGVNTQTQIDKILEDEILGSITPLRGAVGADGNNRKMRVIPLRYVFGWLFTINPKNVKPEIRNQMVEYKMMCYDSLFDMFTKRTEILKERTTIDIAIDKLEEEIKKEPKQIKLNELKQSRKDASRRLNTMDTDVVNDQLDLFKKRDE